MTVQMDAQDRENSQFKFRVPILCIQDYLASIKQNKKYLKLVRFCNDFESQPKGYQIQFDLENQWFPIVCTDNRYLANAVMIEFPGTNRYLKRREE